MNKRIIALTFRRANELRIRATEFADHARHGTQANKLKPHNVTKRDVKIPYPVFLRKRGGDPH